MARFTATEAYEASTDGDPIMVTKAEAAAIIGRHDVDFADEFLARQEEVIDAWAVLSWLGY